VLRLTVSLGVVLGLAAMAGELAVPRVAMAAPEQADDSVADWDKRWAKAIKDSANEYAKIVKKYEDELEATSSYTRRYILRYLPDDDETRANLGYIKEKLNDGTDGWKWVRNDIIRDRLRELSDLEDPKQTLYNKDLAAAHKKVGNWFKALARKATEYGAAKNASADGNWAEKTKMAWTRALEALESDLSMESGKNKDADECHKALGHPKFEGKYVTPYKLQFQKARQERRRAGEKHAAVTVKADPVEPDGMFVSGGFAGGGARSEHMTINTTHGKEAAIQYAQDCERALIDIVEIYGFPETIKERLPCTKINFIKDKDEFRQFMEKAAGWKPAEVTKYIDAGLMGVSHAGERITTSSPGGGARDAAMSLTTLHSVNAAQGAARADLGSSVRDGIEDWLFTSMCYDVTKRVLGTALTTYGAFGRYGDTVDSRPGEDKWIELARRLVLMDDDTPLAELPKRTLENKDLRAPQQIKGWALVQFLFERDPERAKAFLWNALANGTAAAVAAVYPDDEDSPDPAKSMEKLDAEYREWIIKGW
jgi:hypothetical protein